MEKEHGDPLPVQPTPVVDAAETGEHKQLQQSTRPRPKRFVKNQIPDSILNDAALNAAISLLPQNYNFEIHKCVWRVRTSGAKRVALQFPEGLLMYSLIISDILSTFTSAAHCFILGDVTYGACCVDDLSAAALSADLLIHFGHSCLVPIDSTTIPCLYIFVEISIDLYRFHLEAFMIANPGIKTYRYDPYVGKLFLEEYDHKGMKEERKRAIEKARREAKNWGIVLGTLGRQGNPRILDRLEKKMAEKGMTWTVVLMSEISPTRIALFEDAVDAWIQIACPRLSIDWGDAFTKPLLTPFEAEIALGDLSGWWERKKVVNSDVCCDEALKCSKNESSGACDNGGEKVKEGVLVDYPMDYYAQDGGEWNSCYSKKPARLSQRISQACNGNSAIKCSKC
ncbi:uncharacterized protein LOC107791245 isoform X2 [Nicotiana tabacum]|uniref:2-(3-amino-3-carboxypropyl)histidine synthase subunit 1 n=1 Tax=Nicotiana tabacum TaxID=4097 RepID=A0A1S3ZWT3_TOBAC|nr:PREDICTED: diphthamide biosynthesis protein 1-like isoform X2 [Nicotiana tabacum]